MIDISKVGIVVQQGGVPLTGPITNTCQIISDPRIGSYHGTPTMLRFIPEDWWNSIPESELMDSLKWWKAVCPYATFANEPDIEGKNGLYYQLLKQWWGIGGKVIAPAYSNQTNYIEDGADVLSFHCYAGNFTNYWEVLRQSNGRPVIMSEYGDEQHQDKVLLELNDYGLLPNTNSLIAIYLFIWQWQGHLDSGYNLYNKRLVIPSEGSKVIGPTAYATELGPDGSGHSRCGAAAVATDIMAKHAGSYDAYQLLLDVASKLPTIEQSGMTCDQMIAVMKGYGLTGTKWYAWKDLQDALASDKPVHCLVNNWYLQPRCYPAGSGWDALHWITVIKEVETGFYYCYDPLTYLTGEYPTAYQGPNVYTGASIRLAIQATPVSEAGVILTAW